ncbi:hypothetical protein ACLB2K_062253 [Fragaria x ananassa]
MSGVASQPQEEDKKPNDQGAHINLKVKGQDGNEVFFRIKRSTQLKKLMNAYCDRQSVELNSIAFLFDGRLLTVPFERAAQLDVVVTNKLARLRSQEDE